MFFLWVTSKLPELPEVETVVRALFQIKGKKITRVEVIKEHLLKGGITKEVFSESLQGQRINSIERKGKYIFFLLDQFVVISHLRMTGKYFLREKFVEKDHFFHLGLILHLDDQDKLFFCDARNFATFHLQKVDEYKGLYPYRKIGSDLINDSTTTQQLHDA